MTKYFVGISFVKIGDKINFLLLFFCRQIQLSQKLRQSFAKYKSLCLDVKIFKKTNTIEFQQKFPKLENKMVKMYNMIKAEITSFENNSNLDLNSKYAVVNDKIPTIISQLEVFLTSHGIEVTKRDIHKKSI